MPEFLEYHVRGRSSWEFYKGRMTPGALWPQARIEAACRALDGREKPLSINLGGTWGSMRGLMGPEKACTVLYDDPELAHDIIDWFAWQRRTYLSPLVERLRPEILRTGEDICYKNGMLISPAHFREFCSESYREIARLANDCGTDLLIVDTDGDATEFIPIMDELGVNGCFPFEVKAGNDLFALRERFPHFVFIGWLEKEVLNEGNEHLIQDEILSKVPRLLSKGGYFPTVDHSVQPLLTFENMCRFMTLLHEVTGNPEGEFPRMVPG
jgi:uroporphyrinogen decarboxylase